MRTNMRTNDHLSPLSLQRVTSFQSLRAHNCPHCHCNSRSQLYHQSAFRPFSPQHQIYAVPTNNYCPSHTKTQLEMCPNVGVRKMNFGVPNIYYQKQDRFQNVSSSKSDHSISLSKQKSYKAKVNIRYSSPEGISGWQPKTQVAYSQTPFSPITSQVQSLNSKVHAGLIQKPTESESLPRVPSILHRRSSVTKRKKDNSELSKQLKERKEQCNKDQWRVHDGKNRMSLIKKVDEQSVDLLLEKQEQILIAIQISRDLKLHYDYYQTRDISKSSNLFHSS